MTSFHGNQDSDDFDVTLSKVDNNMNIIWEKEFDSDYRDGNSTLIATTDNNYFLTINRGKDMPGTDIEIIKFNSTGDTLFTKKIIGSESISCNDITKRNNNYIFTGSYLEDSTVPGYHGIEIIVSEFDLEGNFLWSNYYGDGSLYASRGSSIINDIDSGYIIGCSLDAQSFIGQKWVAGLLKIDENGNEQWIKRFPITARNANMGKVLQTSDRGYICCLDDNWVNTRIIKLDENGNVDIDDNTSTTLSDHRLKQNYPNPFNPTTKIRYQLAVNSEQLAEIVVYNTIGQEIWSSNPSSLNPNTCTFDGSKFNSGVYYYSLVVDGKKMDTKSMLLIK